jgi:hypothetical protein
MLRGVSKSSVQTMRLALLALGLVTMTPVRALPQTIPQTRGIFAVNPIVSASHTIAPAILTNLYVIGGFVTADWNLIEATEGNFNWRYFDTIISQAAANGMVVTLGVTAGNTTPPWVYADGAQAFNFLWDRATPSPPICSLQSIPIPWDPVFLAKWQTFVQAMGAHYAANPTVVAVMMYGLNFHSIETSLPVTNGQVISSGSTSCTGYNYPALWQAAGYTRTAVENGLIAMQTDFQMAFPNTQLQVGLNPSGFPPIDQNGAIIPARKADIQVVSDLLTMGARSLGQQFAAGNGGLGPTGTTWPLLTSYSATIDTGYQTTTPLGLSLPTAVNAALAAGAHWLQLYPTDISLPANLSAIAAASEAM